MMRYRELEIGVLLLVIGLARQRRCLRLIEDADHVINLFDPNSQKDQG